MKRTLTVIPFIFAATSVYAQTPAESTVAPEESAEVVAVPEEEVPVVEAVEEESTTTQKEEATHEQSSPAAPQMTEQQLLKEMTLQLSQLVSILSTVRDDKTAENVADEVEAMMDKLFSVDYAQMDGVDEEVVAVGLADLFNDLELQVSRLYEEDFYGNADLKETFGADDGEDSLVEPD